MGTPIGFFGDSAPNDYPELNKCPDCETFFESDTCPLCGKICPEEMRAGNRKPIKKVRQPRGNTSGRVAFEPWYHATWFIVAMLIVMPIVGLILLWQSYKSRGVKIALTLLPLAPYILGILLSVIASITGLFGSSKMPTIPDIPREEYIASCSEVIPENLYRSADFYDEMDVQLKLRVTAMRCDEGDYVEETDSYPVYYECEAESYGRTFRFLIRDLQQEDPIRLTEGDEICVYGRVQADCQIYDSNVGALDGVCILAYYIELNP